MDTAAPFAVCALVFSTAPLTACKRVLNVCARDFVKNTCLCIQWITRGQCELRRTCHDRTLTPRVTLSQELWCVCGSVAAAANAWRGMSDSGVKLRHVTATASDESLAMIRSPHHGANANHPNSSQKQKRLEPI